MARENGREISCLDFVTKEMWPSNSHELNPLDYYV